MQCVTHTTHSTACSCYSARVHNYSEAVSTPTHLYQVAKVAEQRAAKPATGSSWSLLGTLSGMAASALVTRLISSCVGSGAWDTSTPNSWTIAAL